jgi:hypothetical protein
MSLAFNYSIIKQRGGNLCGEDRFSIEACGQCQGHYLFNQELKDVYYDTDDLSRRFFKIAGMSLPPCRYCGAINWQFNQPSPDQPSAQAGPWAWSLRSRVFTFDESDN